MTEKLSILWSLLIILFVCEKEITLNSFIYNGKLFWPLHNMNVSKFACKISTSAEEVILENIFASSANKSISIDSSKIDGQALMKIVNNNGPKWEPCGTPEHGNSL